MPLSALELARDLIRCRSVTPADGGAQDVLAAALSAHGFVVTRLRFGEIENLFARRGVAGPHLCFAGHTDVVPPGAGWQGDPFGGVVRDGALYGRGACDMKGAVAAFAAAAAAHDGAGSVSLLITGDEEGDAVDGTVRVLEWMVAHGQVPDLCLVGEPTNPARLGEVVKIGRRGSLRATLTVHGVQGHSAYPQRADNPCHRLVRALAALTAAPLDAGTEWFEPSCLQIVSIDVGNTAPNVIPALATARMNVRFSDVHTAESLERWMRAAVTPHAERYELDIHATGRPFLTEPGPLVRRLVEAIAAESGVTPRLDTGGGTSDARFIAHHCPVAEFGLVGTTMHRVDEHVPLAELEALTRIYAAVLRAIVP